jgi:hypothetical protein
MTRFQRSFGACACSALAACATPPDPGPTYPWPYRDGSPLAPIVIRTAAAKPGALSEDTRWKDALAVGAHESVMSILYSFLLPGFFLVGIPLAIADAHNVYKQTNPPCPPRVTKVLADVPNWIESTFRAVPTLQIVTDETRRQIGAPGPVVVSASLTSASDKRSFEIDQLGRQLQAKTLVVADIQVVFGDMGSSNCTVKLAAIADVRVQPLGKPEMKMPRYSVWAAEDDVPIEDWAVHPEKARQELTVLLQKLAGQLVESYRDRMGCSEQPCDW